MSIVVQRYGGSSVAGVGKLRHVAERVIHTARRGHQLVVVVSAMGDMAAVVTRLDRMLMDALRRTGDRRAAGRGDVFDRFPTYNDPGFKRPDVI